jgi:endogenous inhibitor of DNA gyrase (YacG/DUF329 family)
MKKITIYLMKCADCNETVVYGVQSDGKTLSPIPSSIVRVCPKCQKEPIRITGDPWEAGSFDVE